MHETEIESLISTGHDRLKRLSIIYLRRLYAYIQQLLGVTPEVTPHLFTKCRPKLDLLPLNLRNNSNQQFNPFLQTLVSRPLFPPGLPQTQQSPLAQRRV
jgi:hypothetical protein